MNNLSNITSSILKLNDQDKRKMFSIISEIMQEQIIGYIYIGGTWEPAISPTETYMPLKSFGISNQHVYNSDKFPFVAFPENKTLSEMLNDPINFNDWCKVNLK